MATVHCSNQGESEVKDVTVEQCALFLQQHGQQLEAGDREQITFYKIIIFWLFRRVTVLLCFVIKVANFLRVWGKY